MTDTKPLDLAFVDTETTGLHAGRRAWEVAIIRRTHQPDGTHTEKTTWVMVEDIDLSHADPQALAIGGFHDRHPIHGDRRPVPAGADAPELLYESRAARTIERATRGAVLVGLNVTFDVTTLTQMLRAHRLTPTWWYSPIDVKSMILARPDARPGMSSDQLADLLGVTSTKTQRHTARGDARFTRDLYDAVRATAETRQVASA